MDTGDINSRRFFLLLVCDLSFLIFYPSFILSFSLAFHRHRAESERVDGTLRRKETVHLYDEEEEEEAKYE